MNQFSSRLLRFVFFCTVCFAIFSLSEDVHAEVSRRYLRDPDGCGYTWTSGNDQYTCDLACYDQYTNYGYQKHTYEIYHNSSALGADRENGATGWGQVIVMWQPCTYETVVTQPSCTQAGKSAEICIYCTAGRNFETLPPTGHTEEIIPGKDAGCTQSGLTNGKKCSSCGITLLSQSTIPAKAHTEETMPGKAPTCTETGLTEGTKCSVCGDVIVAQSTIPAKGHNEVALSGYAATCSETGLTEGRQCTVCGAITLAQTTLPAKGHKEEILPGKEATCSETGLTEGKKCSVCNAVTAAQTVIAAREHSFWGEWTIGSNDKHRDFCRHGCGFSVSMSCDFLSVIIDDAELTICPICGRFGDQELAQKKKASISNPAAKIPGTPVIRALLNPVADNPQCLAAITAVYERNGRIAPLADDAPPVTVKLPQMTDAPCQLLFASVDEQTQAPRLLPVEYTLENGQLIFTVNQLGLFLLIAE